MKRVGTDMSDFKCQQLGKEENVLWTQQIMLVTVS